MKQDLFGSPKITAARAVRCGRRGETSRPARAQRTGVGPLFVPASSPARAARREVMGVPFTDPAQTQLVWRATRRETLPRGAPRSARRLHDPRDP